MVWMCRINVIWMYYIQQHHVVASLSFTNPLPWLVKCPLDAHFRILPEIVSHPKTFFPLLHECCKFGHTTLFTFCFFFYYAVGKHAILDAAQAFWCFIAMNFVNEPSKWIFSVHHLIQFQTWSKLFFQISGSESVFYLLSWFISCTNRLKM